MLRLINSRSYLLGICWKKTSKASQRKVPTSKLTYTRNDNKGNGRMVATRLTLFQYLHRMWDCDCMVKSLDLE